MGERRGLKALELWAKRITEGYPGVKIDNMTTSWRDGLAFCAIINHFRPDLIDFNKLNKDDIYRNNELAFRVGQQYLGIPALLDAEDMVEYPVPDRLSIITYVSQYYNALACNAGTSPTRIAPKRQGPVPVPSSTSPPAKMAIRSSNATMEIPERRLCATCKLPVFLIKRFVVGKQLYHEECFRCARCNTQLKLGNYYETEVPGQYCCETCPNEEKQQEHVVPALGRSLSDEEKAATAFYDTTTFATAIEDTLLNHTASSEYSLARSQFMQDLIQDDKTEVDKQEDKKHLNTQDDNKDVNIQDNLKDVKIQDNKNVEDPPELPRTKPPELSSLDKDQSDDFSDNCLPATDSLKLSVNNRLEVNNSSDERTQIDIEQVDKNISTKEDEIDVSSDRVPEITNIKDESLIQDQVIDNSTNTVLSEETIIEISDDSNLIADNLSQDNNLHEHSDDISSSNVSKLDDIIDEEIKSSSEPTNASVSVPCPQDNPSASSTNIKEEGNSTQTSLNPFGDDEENEVSLEPKTPPRLKKIKPRLSEHKLTSGSTGETPESLKTLQYVRISLPPNAETAPKPKPKSLNPFSDDEDDEDLTYIPESTPNLRKLKAPESLFEMTVRSEGDAAESKRDSVPPNSGVPYPKAGYNPFSDDEDDDGEMKTPKPAPQTGYNPFSSDEDDEEHVQTYLSPGAMNGNSTLKDHHRLSLGSTNSLASTASSSINSATSTYRKKRPAPKPPVPSFNSNHSSPQVSITSSPSTSAQHSPKPRKSKRAPLPPVTPITFSSNIHLTSTPNNNIVSSSLDFEKIAKDEANRQTQSNQTHLPSRDKSMYGKWKRKKGKAPALPAPLQKRTVKALPMTEIKRELDIIEVQLQGLDKQGIRLENIIRDQCEGPDTNPNDAIPIEVEDLILQLFEVINEKNEICRRQAELMYLRRQHRLEEEQAEIEYQVRCLMSQSCKTDSDKARETELIERLVEIVNLRAEIVECLEMDRVRGIEEDLSIEYSMNTYANKRDEASATAATSQEAVEKSPKKKEKKFKKKLLKFKRFTKHDVDKDIDESEVTNSSSSSSKSKSKKKK